MSIVFSTRASLIAIRLGLLCNPVGPRMSVFAVVGSVPCTVPVGGPSALLFGSSLLSMTRLDVPFLSWWAGGYVLLYFTFLVYTHLSWHCVSLVLFGGCIVAVLPIMPYSAMWLL